MEKQEHAADDLDAKARALLPTLHSSPTDQGNGLVMISHSSDALALVRAGAVTWSYSFFYRWTDLGRVFARLLSEGAVQDQIIKPKPHFKAP